MADPGLRPSEGLALRWQDFDAAARTLRIERAVSAGQVKLTKTGSTRTVDLTVRLTEALSEWQARCEADALVADHDASRGSSPQSRARRWTRRRCPSDSGRCSSGPSCPRFPSRTCATPLPPIFWRSGTNHLRAAQLGHSNPATTLRHYAHWIPHAHWIPRGDKAWIDLLAEARNSASGSKTVATVEAGNACDV
jgi:integrase